MIKQDPSLLLLTHDEHLILQANSTNPKLLGWRSVRSYSHAESNWKNYAAHVHSELIQAWPLISKGKQSRENDS